jgi:hypothetical protein
LALAPVPKAGSVLKTPMRRQLVERVHEDDREAFGELIERCRDVA